MRIAINTRLMILGKMDGIGWFTAETVRRMVTQHPEHEFYLLFDRKVEPMWAYTENVHEVVLFPPARHPILWYLFFQFAVRRALKRYKIDLFVSTDGWMPLDTDVPTLDVIHDLNFEHAVGNLKRSHQRYMTYFFPQFARYATRIATVSEYSKRDLIETYHLPPEKVDVVYDGAHNNYRPLDEEGKCKVRERYTGGKPYFIFISTILKRKNLTNLLLAFDRYKQNDTTGCQLVVVGQKVWWQDELKMAYDGMRHQEDVVMIGRASPEELSGLLSSAVALVYPSYFEGFGIPILEAFHAETAVITSNVTSMPEVAGEGALLIDPSSVEDIELAMRKVDTDNDLRERLIAEGRKQREKFSWDRTAELLWESICRIKI